MSWSLQRLTAVAGNLGEKRPLIGNEVKIGRMRNNDVLCISIHVSRHHAKIIFKNDQPFIMDLGSANGTFVNKSRIEKNEECRLVNGDTIGLGVVEASDIPDSFVYRILKDSEHEERSSSRTSYNSSVSRSSSPQRPAAHDALAATRSSPPSKTLVKRPAIEIIDLSDNEDQKPLPKKIKPDEKIYKPHSSISSADVKSNRVRSSEKTGVLNGGTRLSSSVDDESPIPLKPETEFSAGRSSKRRDCKNESTEKNDSEKQSSDQRRFKERSSDNRHFRKRSSDKHSSDKHSSDKHSSNKRSSDKHSSDKHSSDKHSSDKHSSDKHSSDKHSSEGHNSEEHSFVKPSSSSQNVLLNKVKFEKNYLDMPNSCKLSLKRSTFEEKTDIDLPPKRPSQSLDISIGDVFLMHSRNEDENSTVLNTSVKDCDRTYASRSRLSTVDKPSPSTSKGFPRDKEDISTSNCKNSRLDSETDSKFMDYSDFDRSLEAPSSDSLRLVIDEDRSLRPSSKGSSEMNTPIGSLRNPRVSLLMKEKSACATSTPHSKSGSSSPSDTPMKSFGSTMSPIPSGKANSASPLMDFGEAKEEQVEVKREPSLSYTLDEDLIVISDDGEDFPSSQLFGDEGQGPSHDKACSDEEDVKPCVEEEERMQDGASPLLGDSDSDSDSIDEVWVARLSQSQSFVKAEPESEHEEVPEPAEIPEPEEIIESEDREKVPKPDEITEPEEPPVPEDTVSSVSESSSDSRRDSVDTFGGMPVSPTYPVTSTAAVTSVAPASRAGARRSTSGPELIEAPPMPYRRAHQRGISVQRATVLQDNLVNKRRSCSEDRGKRKAPGKAEVAQRKAVTKASAKEERKARLREISEKKKAEVSIERAVKSDKKGTAKVKVTDKLRGSFLTEMPDSIDSGKPTKVPTRQSVLQMKQIPKLKNAAPTVSRTTSPLEGLNQTAERYKRSKEPNDVPAVRGLPKVAAAKPTAQVAPRVAGFPKAAASIFPGSSASRFLGEGAPEFPEAATSRLPEAPRVLRTCLRNPLRDAAVYMVGLPRKRVTFRENLVEVKMIESLSTTRPSNQAKDVPITAQTLVRHIKTPAPDLSFDGVLKDVFQWKTQWLEEYVRFKIANPQIIPEDPPAQGARPISVLPSEFVSYEEYYDKMYPLLLIELWNAIVKEWEIFRERRKQTSHVIAIDQVTEDRDIVHLTCHALYDNELECPKLGDLVVCELFATTPAKAIVNSSSAVVVIDAFGFVSSENRDRQVRNVNGMLLIKNPSAKSVVRLTIQIRNRYVQVVKDRLMLLKVVKYIRPELRYFQALKHFKTLSVCPSILSPKADSSAFEIPPAKPSEAGVLVIKADLNSTQTAAILSASKACFLQEPKICVIQGPPGTGKSRVVSCLVMQLLYGVVNFDRKNRERGTIPRILLCAPSNAAVDVLVLRLLEERKRLPREQRFKMVRVGRLETMHPQVRDIALETLARKDVQCQVNMDTSSVETELRMFEARLRASEHALEASKASRRQPNDKVHEDGVRELKRRIAVLQNRLEEGRNAEAPRNSTADRGAVREACKRLLKGADIVATTLSSCFTKLMENVFPPRSNGEYNFSCCIIDEATQCMEVQTLTPLMLGVKTLVLVGDQKQLPATVLSQNARNCGLGTSLFARMLRTLPRAVHFLDTQYRMHPDIIAWPNRYFYGGKLRSPGEMAEGRISPLLPYCVIRTPFRQDSDRREVNTDEAKFVLSLAAVVVQNLLEELTSKEHHLSVGVITPYQRQKQLLISLLHERYPQNQRLKNSIDINTFDSFQGQEKDVVIMSCVRTDKVGFLNDPQRLNVALTRAKFSLLICGNFGALYGDEMWSNLLQDAQSRRRIKDARRNMSDKELWSLVFQPLQ